MGINDSTGNWLYFTNVSGLPTEALRDHRLNIDLFNREFQPQMLHKSSSDPYLTSYYSKMYFQSTNITSSSPSSSNTSLHTSTSTTSNTVKQNQSNHYTREAVFQRALCRIYLVDYVCLRYALPPICADILAEIEHFTNHTLSKVHRITNLQKTLLDSRKYSDISMSGGVMKNSSGSSKSTYSSYKHIASGRSSKLSTSNVAVIAPRVSSNSGIGSYKSIGGHDITGIRGTGAKVGITTATPVKPTPVVQIFHLQSTTRKKSPLQLPPPSLNNQPPPSRKVINIKRGLPKPQPQPYKSISK